MDDRKRSRGKKQLRGRNLWIFRLLLLLSAAGILLFGSLFLNEYREYRAADQEYASLREHIEVGTESGETEESAEGGERYGIGFLAELPDIVSPESFSLLVKRVFRLPAVELYDAGRPVKRIACCPGSGRGQLANVLRSGAELFLSGDLGHHDGLDFVEAGISLVNAGHYGLEHPFSEELAGLLSAKYPELSVTAAPIRFPARFL